MQVGDRVRVNCGVMKNFTGIITDLSDPRETYRYFVMLDKDERGSGQYASHELDLIEEGNQAKKHRT